MERIIENSQLTVRVISLLYALSFIPYLMNGQTNDFFSEPFHFMYLIFWVFYYPCYVYFRSRRQSNKGFLVTGIVALLGLIRIVTGLNGSIQTKISFILVIASIFVGGIIELSNYKIRNNQN